MKTIAVILFVLLLLMIPANALAYEVQVGDTWSSIAADNGISTCTLMRANKLHCSLAWKTLPGPGSNIKVPAAPPPIVKKRCMEFLGQVVCP